jgi:hypothetical protein
LKKAVGVLFKTFASPNMKSWYHLILILLAIIVACKTDKEKQEKKNYTKVLPFREGKLWGLANEKGEILVKPKYDYIDFSHGEPNPNLFPVFDKGKWGVIDSEGKEIIPIQFWRVNIFPNVIIVGDTPEDKSALYSTSGRLLLPAEFDAIDYVKPYQEKWQNLLLIYQKGKVGIYDIVQEKILLPLEYEIQSISVSNSDAGVFALAKDGKLALFDTKGKQVSDFKYQEYGGGTIRSEGYAKVQDLNGLWGIVDKNGKELVPCKYKGMGSSVCNQRIAFQGNNGKWGYLNVTNGEEIVQPEYDRARDFSDGFGEVEKNRKVGFVDVNGKVVVPVEYEGALNVQKGICFMMKKGDWFPIRVAENKPINNEKYSGGNFDFTTEFAVVSCKNENALMQGVINTKGETLIPCRQADYGFIIYPQNAVLNVKEEEFLIFSLPQGKELFRTTKQPTIEKDFMLVKQANKYIVADLQGNKISEVEAASVQVVRGYLKVSNKEEEYEMTPPIDVSANLAAPPLEERYIPDISKVKGLMNKEGRKFWKD